MTPGINIFYGPEIWSLQLAGGISRYFSELIPRTSTSDNKVYTFATPNQNVFIERIPRDSMIEVSKFTSSYLLDFIVLNQYLSIILQTDVEKVLSGIVTKTFGGNFLTILNSLL